MDEIPRQLLLARQRWRYTGSERPSFATAPEPGQESVWDYSRPPRIESDTRAIAVMFGEVVIAETRRALRVLETAGAPTFYIPRVDARTEHLEPSQRHSWCEWKGRAAYWSLHMSGTVLEGVAWSYPDPFPGYEALVDHYSFYPSRLTCTVDGERVRPQPGGFYGGWVTDELVGPIKGEPGSEDW